MSYLNLPGGYEDECLVCKKGAFAWDRIIPIDGLILMPDSTMEKMETRAWVHAPCFTSAVERLVSK